MIELAWEIAKKIDLNEDNLRSFLNETFSEVARTHGLDGTHFQYRAKLMGDAFEACFEVIMKSFYPEIDLKSGVELPEACMMRQGKADFVVYQGNSSDSSESRLIAIIEAKGSADHIVAKDGRRIKIKRPGMTRTDTVKKAISNAYQVFRVYPDALFFIVTSHKPNSGNAKCMCDLAEGDIVDKIVDVTNIEELSEMISLIQGIDPEFQKE